MMIFTQDGDLVNSIWIRSITPMTGELEGKTVYALTAQFGFLGQSEKDPDLDASTVELGVYSSEEEMQQAQGALLADIAEQRSLIYMP